MANRLLEILDMLLRVAQLITVDDDRTHSVHVSFAGRLEIWNRQDGQLGLVFVGAIAGPLNVLVVLVYGGQRSQRSGVPQART